MGRAPARAPWPTARVGGPEWPSSSRVSAHGEGAVGTVRWCGLCPSDLAARDPSRGSFSFRSPPGGHIYTQNEVSWGGLGSSGKGVYFRGSPRSLKSISEKDGH